MNLPKIVLDFCVDVHIEVHTNAFLPVALGRLSRGAVFGEETGSRFSGMRVFFNSPSPPVFALLAYFFGEKGGVRAGYYFPYPLAPLPPAPVPIRS